MCMKLTSAIEIFVSFSAGFGLSSLTSEDAPSTLLVRQVTRGYKIFADEWAGAYTPPPNTHISRYHNSSTLNALFQTFGLEHNRLALPTKPRLKRQGIALWTHDKAMLHATCSYGLTIGGKEQGLPSLHVITSQLAIDEWSQIIERIYMILSWKK